MEHLKNDGTGTRQERRRNTGLRVCRLQKPREISPRRTVFLYKLYIKNLHLDEVSVILVKENSRLYWKYLDLQTFEDNNCRCPISYYCGYCNPEAKPSQLKKTAEVDVLEVEPLGTVILLLCLRNFEKSDPHIRK